MEREECRKEKLDREGREIRRMEAKLQARIKRGREGRRECNRGNILDDEEKLLFTCTRARERKVKKMEEGVNKRMRLRKLESFQGRSGDQERRERH